MDLFGGDKMEFKDNLPIYIQIINLIRKNIASGLIKEGEKLQSVRELSIEFKVNPNTIQRAYSELEREKLVYTQRGMGTFVTEDKNIIIKLKDNMAINIVNNFILDMKSIGMKQEEIISMIEKRIKED